MKIRPYLTCMSLFIILMACQEQNEKTTSKIKEGMVKVTIMYENGEGKTFDMDYYKQKHMPMLDSLFGTAMLRYHIDKGIAGRGEDEPVPYLAIGYLYFDTLDAYLKAFGPHAETILGDIPNYTNIRPRVQISEIVK